MKKLNVLLGILLFVTLVGCSSISTNTDYDPTVDFSKYKTYQWFSGEMPEGEVLSQNPLIKKRVANSVENSLSAKGFTKGTEDNFDFVVIIHAGSKERMQVNSYNYGGYGYGRYGRGWGGSSTTSVNYYDETTLIIDIIDSKTKELAWRGTATGVVRKAEDQAEAQANVDEVVNKIMLDFPPVTKK